MIEKTNALEVFEKNIERTNSLIVAMEKVEIYNRLYQTGKSKDDPQYAIIVAQVQNAELRKIEKSCGEHAIISLTTAFETYYKELLQQLLFEYPDFFLSQHTKHDNQVHDLIEKKERFSYEQIEEKLKLKSRFDYYRFFERYSIPLLSAEEIELIEYVYVRRNNLVHCAGRMDRRAEARLKSSPVPVNNISIKTDSKKLRTKFIRLINSVDERIEKAVLK